MTFGEWKDIFELASYVTIVLGLPIAIVEYRRKTKKEQQDREYGTYNALDEKYLEFQRLCFDHPQLDIFDIPDTEPRDLSSEEQKEELVAFTMLFSIFERAYLMYADQSSTIKRRQWTGWHEYITDFCARENFRRAWHISGNTFDTTFQEFVEATITRVELAKPTRGLTVRPVDTTNVTDVAVVVDLVTNARIAGSRLTSNEFSYLLSAGAQDLQLSNTVLLATAPDGTNGALIATSLYQRSMLFLSGIGVRGPSVASVIHALLRGLGSIDQVDSLAADMLLIETPTDTPAVVSQGIPGMGSFRELDLQYHYPDGSDGRLWIWTTGDAIPRADVATILRQLLGGFYGPLRSRTLAQVTTAEDVERHILALLRNCPDPIRIKPAGVMLRPVASAR